MEKEIKVNKLNKRDKKKIEHLTSRFITQGMSRDEAHQKALEEVSAKETYGHGGGHASGGEPHQHKTPK